MASFAFSEWAKVDGHADLPPVDAAPRRDYHQTQTTHCGSSPIDWQEKPGMLSDLIL